MPPIHPGSGPVGPVYDGFDNYTDINLMPLKWTNELSGSTYPYPVDLTNLYDPRIGSGHDVGTSYSSSPTGGGLYLPSGAGVCIEGLTDSNPPTDGFYGRAVAIYMRVKRTSASDRELINLYHSTQGLCFKIVWKSSGAFEVSNFSGVVGTTAAVATGTSWYSIVILKNTTFVNGIRIVVLSSSSTPDLDTNIVDGSGFNYAAGGNLSGGGAIGGDHFCIGANSGGATTGTSFYVDDLIWTISQGFDTFGLGSNVLFNDGYIKIQTDYPTSYLSPAPPNDFINNAIFPAGGPLPYHQFTNSNGNQVNNFNYVNKPASDTSSYITRNIYYPAGIISGSNHSVVIDIYGINSLPLPALGSYGGLYSIYGFPGIYQSTTDGMGFTNYFPNVGGGYASDSYGVDNGLFGSFITNATPGVPYFWNELNSDTVTYTQFVNQTNLYSQNDRFNYAMAAILYNPNYIFPSTTQAANWTVGRIGIDTISKTTIPPYTLTPGRIYSLSIERIRDRIHSIDD